MIRTAANRNEIKNAGNKNFLKKNNGGQLGGI